MACLPSLVAASCVSFYLIKSDPRTHNPPCWRRVYSCTFLASHVTCAKCILNAYIVAPLLNLQMMSLKDLHIWNNYFLLLKWILHPVTTVAPLTTTGNSFGAIFCDDIYGNFLHIAFTTKKKNTLSHTSGVNRMR